MMKSSEQPAIEFATITKTFPGVTALSEVSFSVQPGELLAICGENGAGKSTLMKILSGVITDYEGAISINGASARFRGTRDAEHAGISIIHQELNLVEPLSVAANIFLGREIRGPLGLLNDAEMVRQSLTLFKELETEIDPRIPVGQLRVGDQQLVEIAKALSLNAKILIMDEPTSALTESEVVRLYRVIEKLRSANVTILYISHKMDEVFRLADRILVMRDGRVITSVEREKTNASEVTQWMVGRKLDAFDSKRASEPREPESGEVVLRIENLSLPWPGHAREWRLHDISFELHKGEVLGIAGLMGAGRTELLECLFGANSQPTTGKITLAGKQVSFTHPEEAKRAGVALVTEDRKRLGIFPQMNVSENITLSQLGRSMPAGIIRQQVEAKMAESIVQRMGVKTAGIEAAITTLSGGNQQKCLIGRWLLTDPSVLLLDDPTRGIDVGAKAELYRLIDKLCGEGLSIILTSSELPELLTVCDRILVLAEGRLTAEFSRKNATEEKILAAAMQ
jgi:ABC-type sugar transport system ATPase subunit